MDADQDFSIRRDEDVREGLTSPLELEDDDDEDADVHDLAKFYTQFDEMRLFDTDNDGAESCAEGDDVDESNTHRWRFVFPKSINDVQLEFALMKRIVSRAPFKKAPFKHCILTLSGPPHRLD